MNKYLSILIATGSLSGILLAQTVIPTQPTARMANAYKVCDEGCTIVSMPVGTVYQFGTDNVSVPGTLGWEPSATSTADTVLPLWANYTTLGDPAPGVVKEFDVQETSQPQTIIYTTNGSPAQVSVTVPALVPTPPVTELPFTIDWTPSNTTTCWLTHVSSKGTDGKPFRNYTAKICTDGSSQTAPAEAPKALP